MVINRILKGGDPGAARSCERNFNQGCRLFFVSNSYRFRISSDESRRVSKLALLVKSSKVLGKLPSILFLSLSMAIGLSGCSLSTGKASSSPTTVSTHTSVIPGVTSTSVAFGEVIPQSNMLSYAAVSSGIRAYFDSINAGGGVRGRKLVLNSVISSTDGTAGKSISDLVSKGHVFGIIGTGPFSVMSPALTEIQANDIPVVGSVTGAPPLFEVTRPYVFNIGPSYVTEGQAIAGFVQTSKDAGKVAVLYQNDTFGLALLSGFESVMPSNTSLIPFRPTDTDFSSQASEIQANSVKTVIIFAKPGTVGNILDSFSSVGIDPKIIISQTSLTAGAYSTGGSGLNNIYVSGFIPPLQSANQDPQVASFEAAMQKYQPTQTINQYSAWGWESAQVAVAALRADKSAVLNRQNYIASLASLKNLQTLAGVVSYNGQGGNALNSANLYQLSNGHRVLVTN